VTSLPNKGGNSNNSEVETLFRGESGFIAVRYKRELLFVDFDSVKSATNAMRKHQGWKKNSYSKGIIIDYDKDERYKRNLAYEKEKESKMLAVLSGDYFCSVCGSASLRVDAKVKFENLKKRSTDGSYALPEDAEYIREMYLVSGEVKVVERPKGMEKQWRLNCKGCGVWCAYRCTPPDVKSPFLYLLDKGLTDTPTHIRVRSIESDKK
jgi:hypothetical protein